MQTKAKKSTRKEKANKQHTKKK